MGKRAKQTGYEDYDDLLESVEEWSTENGNEEPVSGHEELRMRARELKKRLLAHKHHVDRHNLQKICETGLNLTKAIIACKGQIDLYTMEDELDTIEAELDVCEQEFHKDIARYDALLELLQEHRLPKAKEQDLQYKIMDAKIDIFSVPYSPSDLRTQYFGEETNDEKENKIKENAQIIKEFQKKMYEFENKITLLTDNLSQKDKEIKKRDADIAKLNTSINELKSAKKPHAKSSANSNYFEFDGLIWADRNIGAVSELDFGDYFAWGEVRKKEDYSKYSYIYCWDSPPKLPPSQDVATVKLRDGWRMPTRDEFDNLLNNCSWKTECRYGVFGLVFTNEGKTLFLPAAGCRDGSSRDCEEQRGYYWSSSVHDGDAVGAFVLAFLSGDAYTHSYYRYYGFSVRAVRCSN